MRSQCITPIILSGGSEAGLWPVSRESLPSHLGPLLSERSQFQETVLRATGAGFAPPIVVCDHEQRFMIAEQLRAIGIRDGRIVLEPMGRNSAPAVAAAALLAAEEDPDVLIWILPTDHAIADLPGLHRALTPACEAAHAGWLVTFGVQAKDPEATFGYIHLGNELDTVPGVHAIASFIEKPDSASIGCLTSGDTSLCNSGMVLASARTILQEMEVHAPDVLTPVRQSVSARRIDIDFIRLDEAAFKLASAISLEYAILEHTKRASVMQVSIGWSEVSDWNAVWKLGSRDENGNVVIGDVVSEGTRNCYLRSDGLLAAVVGLQDVALVVTRDAVLATHRDRAHDVDRLVKRLQTTGRPESLAHDRVYRPWGYYESLIRGHRFQVKRIEVTPGQQLSLQKHLHRAEHWVVVRGTARITRDNESFILHENEGVYLPLGCIHRLENPGKIPLTLIEVQSGSYLGEDDIIRLEDTYGRTASVHDTGMSHPQRVTRPVA